MTAVKHHVLEPLLGVKELAALLGIVPGTFHLWRKAGKIPDPDIRWSRKMQRWKLSTVQALLVSRSGAPVA